MNYQKKEGNFNFFLIFNLFTRNQPTMSTKSSYQILPNLIIGYRVVVDDAEDGMPLFHIAIVTRETEDSPLKCLGSPGAITGFDLKTLKMKIDFMTAALEEPVLYGGKRFPEEYKPE